MYGHGNEYSSMEFLAHFSLPEDTTAHLTYTPLMPLPSLAIPGNEYDSVSALKSELQHSSSGYSNIGSPNSITSYGRYSPTLIQRSISSHSLHKDFESYCSPVNNSSTSDKSSVRKLLSTDDLQGVRLAQHKQSLNSSIANEYECRKTLADSRPRVRGRFTRNDDIEKMTQTQLDHAKVEEDDDNWIKFLNAFSANLLP
ncbi:uncharacterized protein LOC111394098 isoform X2 [Olea europaea var. sylvestris]|uniref:uncharacterized protein LOC111394098 isoform X2 n=1 Tax=Olea europaea var. sylvestris TaxID=158386 RepID=UPI000C1CE0EB|nr:uncharacterized protein LOC111394098 isoform X2 [Olea europaea var. sylvestris]